MRSLSRAYRRWTPATIGVLLLLGCGLLGLVGLPEYPSARRVDAQSRWSTRPFSSYQIAVRVEYGGNTCMQTIETQGEQLSRIVRNDCRLSWLSLLTVARLFEISERLEHPAPCYAAGQTCSCYRIRSGEIAYDAHLGYPRLIAYRREVRPNLLLQREASVVPRERDAHAHPPARRRAPG